MNDALKLAEELEIGWTEKDFEMLLGLFRIYGPSHGETPVLEFIKNILTKNNIPFKQDKNGNIYCLNHKGQPLLSAHTDCVGTEESGYYVRFIDIYPYQKSNELIMKGIGNIGGDDKCGVFLILEYLLSGKPINAVFSICEEIGGADGIKTLINEIKDDEIFKSCPYALVLDRRNWGDIICHINEYGSKKFEDALTEIGKDFNYSPVKGGSSDANTLKDYMNCCNLSTAYYNPHSTREYVSINELWNTWNYINALIEKMPRDIPLEKKEPVVWSGPVWDGTKSNSWNNSSWNNSSKDLKKDNPAWYNSYGYYDWY